jgi:phthalate 4,5-dioxygenase oxygenase subunit
VPIDNANCMFYWIAWHPTKGIEQDAWRRFCGAVVGTDLDAEFRKLRNAGNRYLQDREALRNGDFTGIRGIPAQDMAMWESMGPIANRSEEHLGASDRAVIQFRKQMLAAVRAVANGEPAIGTREPRTPHAELSTFEGMVAKSDWHASAGEDL